MRIEWNDAGQSVQQASQYNPAIFDKKYFDAIGARDHPFFEIVTRQVLQRRPESVLELGAGRGYVLKRLQDAGVGSVGFDVSQHCWLTRVCEGVSVYDLRNAPWPVPGTVFDLGFSFGFWEHIPESALPVMLAELGRCTKRGLHGISFNDHDGINDPTRITFRPREWWRSQFDAAGLREHEIVEKVQLMSGPFPPEVIQGDGRAKISIGAANMFHYGWLNIDAADWGQMANANGYQFQRHDVKTGLTQKTGEVDAIFSAHALQKMTYKEGQSFLKDCRRVIKTDGAMRISVPDAGRLMWKYFKQNDPQNDLGGDDRLLLPEFDQLNDGCANAPTSASKLWELLVGGDHKAFYDAETLELALREAGWVPQRAAFRQTNLGPAGIQLLKETTDVTPELSLIYEAVPLVG